MNFVLQNDYASMKHYSKVHLPFNRGSPFLVLKQMQTLFSYKLQPLNQFFKKMNFVENISKINFILNYALHNDFMIIKRYSKPCVSPLTKNIRSWFPDKCKRYLN